MRRYARALVLIAILVVVAGLVIGIQKIKIGNFERGGDTWLGLSLGLDLQGGSHLVYQAKDPETGEAIVPAPGQMEGLKRIIEQRVNASGLGEPIIQILGDDRLLIQLPGVSDTTRAKGLIGETARLEFKHRILEVPRDLVEVSGDQVVDVRVGTLPLEQTGEAVGHESGAGTLVLPEPSEGQPGLKSGEGAISAEGQQGETSPQEAAQVQGSEGQTAVEEAGQAVTEGEGQGNPEVAVAGEPQGPPVLLVDFTKDAADEFQVVLDRLVKSLTPRGSSHGSGAVPPNRLEVSVEGDQSRRYAVLGVSIQRIDGTGEFAFPLAPGENDESMRAILGSDPRINFTEIQGAVDEDIGLSGSNLIRAYPSQHASSGAPIVTIEFDADGTRTFGKLTGEIAGSTRDQIAIFLDGEELISPVVQTAITSGSAIIQGNDFTIERVKDLALLLQAGALPIPIELIQERDVDAILGADSLSKSVLAGGVGFALVFVFMTLYYRLPGLIASGALLIYGMLVIVIFKMLPITLTLAGIAAVILSIGMAVDANILIFERMKDELRLGRTLMSSINIGFNRAWPAIRDGNVSTLITSGVLFYFSDQFGTTVVQGFAVALAIGVLLSMFSAIVLSRTLLRVVTTTGIAHRLDLFVPTAAERLPQRQQRTAAIAQRS